MEEKRKHPRAEINEPAYVSSGGSVMSCVVRNISPQGAAIDIENPGRGVSVAGLDRNLPALPGTRLDADRLQRNREQSGGDLFAGGDHGIIFAGIVHGGGFAAPFHQFVGLAGHRRDNDCDIMTAIDLALDVSGDVADAFDIGDRCAAEFHHETAHDELELRLRSSGAFPRGDE